MPNFKEYNQAQGMFMTMIPNELLEPDHPARIIDTIVESLNLNTMINHYSDEGNEAYDPKMMTKVLFYSYQQGIFSGRKMQAGLKVRADFIYLSGGQVPDFRTLNLFRIRHKKVLIDIFAQIVILCDRLDMVDFKNLAVDGQKIQANASFKKNYNRDRLEKALKRVKNGITKLLDKEINDSFTQEIKKVRISRLEKKKDELKKLQKELESILDEKASINQTDKDAKIMKHKDRRIVPSYNHQSAVDEKCGITVTVQTTQSNDNSADLFSILDQSIENSGKKHENILADCGFADYESLEKMETQRDEKFYVPDKLFDCSKKSPDEDGKIRSDQFELREDGNYYCPNGKVMEEKQLNTFKDSHSTTIYECKGCIDCPLKKRCTKGKARTITIDSREDYRRQMRERLKSDQGREIYMKRQYIVEVGHGNDQKNKGWKQHYLRGLTKASLEFLLMRIGSNLGKIIKFRPNEILAMELH
ncbi:MAG: IS1182 family transposase [Candidatus Pacebacteria bacterium]|nr:IS1182 family transposase [Candidatus Paceibacterota bacterium]